MEDEYEEYDFGFSTVDEDEVEEFESKVKSRVAEETATLYGVPDRLQRSPEEKDALRQQRAQQMAQQQALQTAMEGTKAIKNIADADRE